MTEDLNRLAEMHDLGLQVAGLGLGSVDYVADTITLDRRAAELFDLDADVPIKRDDLHARIHADDRPSIDDQLSCLLDPTDENFIDVEHRVLHRDGTVLWLSARKQVKFSPPDQDGQKKPFSGLVAIIDITRHKRDQDRIKDLMDEVNHRSKNVLTVVQGLARRTFATGEHNTFLDRFADRINGLVRNQEALVKGNWVGSDLEDLIESHLHAFVSAESPRIALDGPPIALDAKASQAIGMAMHELATNATKYGALSSPNGEVRVAWRLLSSADPELVISWSEHNGPPVVQPKRSGFGQKVMKDMAAASLNGTVTLEYRKEGVFWQLRMPYPKAKT